MHKRLARLVLAGGHIELKAVPWAGDDAAGKLTASQRAALMGADAIEGVELAVNIEQRHNLLSGNELAAGPRREIGSRGKAGPVGHCSSSLVG